MAGETTKSTALTNRDAGTLVVGRRNAGTVKVGLDTYQFAAATSLEAGDNLILDIPIPSNAIINKVEIYNDDLDTNACPTLVLDVGVAAGEDQVTVTSGTVTKFAKDAIVDADLLIDGATTGQAATTNWTVLTPDSATWGPEDAVKSVWELLGYDSDPKTFYNIVVQSQAAAASLGSAGDLSVRVTYTVD